MATKDKLPTFEQIWATPAKAKGKPKRASNKRPARQDLRARRKSREWARK